MAFVKEAITEQDKEKYRIERLSDYQYMKWNTWVIDRDRECFLLYNGMSHDLPFQYFFILSYKDRITKITVDVKGNGKSSEGVNLTDYDITSVQLPEHIKDKKDEIIRLFVEAVEVREDTRNKNRKVSVIYLGKKMEVN